MKKLKHLRLASLLAVALVPSRQDVLVAKR
jgi:hypothetical protein